MALTFDTSALRKDLAHIQDEYTVADIGLEAIAEGIASRARSHLPPGGMAEAVRTRRGKNATDGDYVDVGVLRGSGKVTDWHGRPGASVDEVAVPLEFGHHDGIKHVPPHPFMRNAIAEELSAQGGGSTAGG
jgi:hypothetical protein